MKDAYFEYSRVYDQHIGERNEIPVLRDLVDSYCPGASSILEFACGTGEILAHFSADYHTVGLDLSESMLAVAKNKLPQVSFVCGDMTKTSVEEKFDLVLCIFNSVNHLLEFGDWKLLFQNAARHLNPQGVFIFDINTEAAFKSYIKIEDIVEASGNDIMTASFTPGKGETMDITCRIFKHIQDQDFRLINALITEKTYPIDKIRGALLESFQSVEMYDPESDKPGAATEVMYFVCRQG